MKRKPEPVRPGFPLRLLDTPKSLRVAVDLTHIRPGGENGGVKPFIFEYLRELGRREGTRLTFLFLTWARSHSEVRQLARPWDHMICVRFQVGDELDELGDWRAGEWLEPSPPVDLLIRLKADVLYAPLGAAEFACPGIPVVATIVDLLHRDYPETLSPQDIGLREQYFADLITRVDRFQCISHYTESRLHLHYQVSPERTFCTHIVIQQRLDIPGGTCPAPADRPYFLYPANAWEHKNHLTLLVAYRLYRRMAGVDAWNLVLTGHDSPSMRQVMKAADSLGIGESVHYYGHLPEAQFAALWRQAAALVFPSLHEGFGIPLLEAMHFGVPILCSSEGSLSEVGGDAAQYADARNPQTWADSMLRLASSADLRQKLIAGGQKQLARFQIAAEVQEFADQLHALARHPGTSWHRGVHPDGWMERIAVFSVLEPHRFTHVRVRIAPPLETRRLRAYQGLTPLGGWTLAAGTAIDCDIPLLETHHSLVLECPDAGNLNIADARLHGVIITGVELYSAHETITLF